MTFSDQEIALFDGIQRLCRARHPLMVEGGEYLDREYGLEATRARIESERSNAERHGGAPLDRPLPKEYLLAEGMSRAAAELAGRFEDRDDPTASSTEPAWRSPGSSRALAAVLVLTWLLWEPFADQVSPPVCEFQALPWDRGERSRKYLPWRGFESAVGLTDEWVARAKAAWSRLSSQFVGHEEPVEGEQGQPAPQEEARAWLHEKLLLVAGLVESDPQMYLLEREPSWDEGLDCDNINGRARSASLIGPDEYIIEPGEDPSTDPGTPKPTRWVKIYHPVKAKPVIRIVVMESSGSPGKVTKGHTDSIARYLRAWAERCERRAMAEDHHAEGRYVGAHISRVAPHPRGVAESQTEWQTDRQRLRFLVREMLHRLKEAPTWTQLSGVSQIQDEAETLALKLRFPGAPLKLVSRHRGEAGFPERVSGGGAQLVEVLECVQHGPFGEHNGLSLVGSLVRVRVGNEERLQQVPEDFETWRDGACRILQAWERAIDGLRADDGAPFRYPGANALLNAIGEVTCAFAVYSVVLEMLAEPIDGAASTTERLEVQYIPPAQSLPHQLPESGRMRAEWEAYRETLDAGVRERFRRLDMYFVTRMEADEAAAQCEAAADGAAGELDEGKKPASEQITTRARSVLAGLRDHVRPWHELGPLMSPDNIGGFPKDPAAEAEAIRELCSGLRALIIEIRPIAEQRIAEAAQVATFGEGPGQGAVEPDGRNGTPVHKPDGWTKAELLAQANEDDKILSASKFDTIRERANVKAAPKGGAGPHHKYSIPDLKKLIAEVEGGGYRKSAAIAEAWRELLGSDEPAANPR